MTLCVERVVKILMSFIMNSRGLEQSCAVLAVNVSNNDITVTDNAMLVSLIKYEADGAVLRANANSLIDDCDKTVIIDDGDYR